MFLLNKPPNPLLSKITHFLKKKKSDEYVKKIYSLINSTPSSELVPSFTFLSRWITENIGLPKKDIEEEKKTQTAIYIIGQISLKLPTVILLTGFFESCMVTNKPYWRMRDFYVPLQKRIIKLRSYMKPFALYSQLPSSFQTFPEDPPINLTSINGHNTILESTNYQNFYIELESDPSYRTAILLYFKRMILNHAPIDSFKPLVCQRSSRSILTKAIIELLKELNKTREATQEQLIFAFSTVFLYIHSFVLSNEIDSQSLCEYLQTRSFISPFCALAMVNHIPSNLYLFNLLAPKEMSVHLDHQTEIKPSQYVMIDLSKSSNLNGFVSKMPTIISNYFLSNSISTSTTDTYNNMDDNDFLSFVHLSPANLYNKMKVVLSVTRERPLGPVQVSSMGILLLRCIIFSVQKTYLDCIDTNMFTQTFCEFIQTIFSILTITFSDSLGNKFFDIAAFQKDHRMVELILRPVVKYTMVICLNMQMTGHLFRFCFMAAKIEESKKTAHTIIRRFAQCGRLVVNQSIIAELEVMNDVFFLIEYMATLPLLTYVKTFREYNSLINLRDKLVAKLGISISMGERETVIIDRFDSSVMFTKSKKTSSDVVYNRSIFTSLEKLNAHNCVKELNKLIKSGQDNLLVLLHIMSMTRFFQNFEFASILTVKVKEFLANDQYTEEGPTKFELRPVDHAFPVALGLIERLLVYSYNDLVIDLLTALEKPLREDQVPLHYLSHFLSRYRSLLTIEMLSILDRVVSSLQCADRFYVHLTSPKDEDKTKSIKKIAYNLIENDMVLIQDPDIINHEYHSIFTHALVFSQLSLGLSTLTDDEIARLLYLPINDLCHSWLNRKSVCLVLSKLASSMNDEIALKYFSLIMEMKNSQISILCGRLFLMECKIDLYRSICFGCRSLIKNQFERLDFFMKMIMPSFVRLNEGVESATALIGGFLECIGLKNAPKNLVEEVLDSIGLFFMKIDMSGSKQKVISFADKFVPQMKDDIITCIETSKDAGDFWDS